MKLQPLARGPALHELEWLALRTAVRRTTDLNDHARVGTHLDREHGARECFVTCTSASTPAVTLWFAPASFATPTDKTKKQLKQFMSRLTPAEERAIAPANPDTNVVARNGERAALLDDPSDRVAPGLSAR